MIRPTLRSTLTDTLFPYTTLFRSHTMKGPGSAVGGEGHAVEGEWELGLECFQDVDKRVPVLFVSPIERVEAIVSHRPTLYLDVRAVHLLSVPRASHDNRAGARVQQTLDVLGDIEQEIGRASCRERVGQYG